MPGCYVIQLKHATVLPSKTVVQVITMTNPVTKPEGARLRSMHDRTGQCFDLSKHIRGVLVELAVILILINGFQTNINQSAPWGINR